MNLNHRFRISAESSLAWAFLFLVVIVLPALVVRHAWMSGIEEEFQAGLDRRRELLVEQSRCFIRAREPDLAMRSLFQRATVTKSRFLRTIESLDRAFPETFRWICWNEDGRLLNLPLGFEMKGRRLWQEVVPRYFWKVAHDVRVRGMGFTEDPSVAALQILLGNDLKLDDLLKNPGRFFEARIAGVRHRLLWSWVKPPKAQPSGISASEEVAGVLVFVRFEKLPLTFWQSFALRMVSANRKTGAGLAMIDLRDSRRSFVDQRLSVGKGFLRELREGFQGRSGETFRCAEHLAYPIPGLDGDSERVFALASLADLERNARLSRIRTDGLTFLAMFLGLAASIALRFGAARDLSLRWRITGLFALAVLLPLSGVLYLGSNLTARETERLRSRSYSTMRSAAERYEAGFADFPIRYGRILERDLAHFLARGPTVADVAAHLKRKHAAGWIYAYYISDEKGGTAVWSSQVDDANTQNMLKLLLRNAYIDRFGGGSGKGALADVLAEEAQKMSANQGIELRSGNLMKSSLARHQFGKISRWLMYLSVRIDGSPRMICLEVKAAALERAYSLWEFRRTARTKRGEDERNRPCELQLVTQVKGQFVTYPSENSFALPPILARAAEFSEEAKGEVDFDGHPYLYHLARGDWKFIRPLFLTPLAPIQAQAQESQARIRAAIGLAGSAALILGLVLAGLLLAPIERLDAAVRQVGDGDLHVVLPETSGDEIGRLGRNFNLMVGGLRERERMRAYVSETVLEAVRDDGRGVRKNDGEIREVTVLFSDIRDFTTISERETPERVFAMLNEFLGGAEEEIRRFGGRVDKFIGDAVMAVFPVAGPEGAWSAVRAALALHGFLTVFNAARRERGLFPIEIGIGINTGRVMLGDVGSARRKDLTVIGDEVNLAARLESASKYGKHTRIVLSERTRDCVAERVTVVEMPITEVKGKKAPVRMFELVELFPARGGSREDS